MSLTAFVFELYKLQFRYNFHHYIKIKIFIIVTNDFFCTLESNTTRSAHLFQIFFFGKKYKGIAIKFEEGFDYYSQFNSILGYPSPIRSVE